MIDVPYAVKRALKDGNRPKNYRIVVQGPSATNWVYTTTFDIRDVYKVYIVERSGVYTFGADSEIPPEEPVGYLYGYFLCGVPGGERREVWFKLGDRFELFEGEVLQVLRYNYAPGIIYLWRYLEESERSFTIDNNDIVRESVKIDERMCSGDRLKFGLCEGASIEFQYFNHINIRGRQIKVYLDVAYDDDGTEAYYPISLGYFDIDQCSTQFSTGIIKAVGYNKLRSSYLDQKANAVIEEAFDGIDNVVVMDILNYMLDGYTIDAKDHTYLAGTTTETNQTGGQNVTIRYSNVTTDFGNPLTPDGVYVDSTTTNVYPNIDYIIVQWIPANGDYVQVRNTSALDFDEIAATVKDQLADALGALSINQTTQTVINDTFYNLYEYTLVKNSKYACSFVVGHTDNTKEYYGLTNGGASFKDIFKKTLENVSYISFCFIRRFYMGLTRYSTSVGVPTYALCMEEMLPYGTTTYHWQDSNHIDHTENYTYPEELYNISLTGMVNAITVAEVNDVTGADTIELDPVTMPEVTLRELQSAVYEMSALYGQLDRETDLFYGVELNSGSLTPSASLYPSATLYPNQGYGSNIFRPFPSEYQKLWTDSVGEQTFRYLIITYKAIEYDQQGNPTEVDKTLQRTVHEHGTTNYNCSDNWLFRNLVWTAEQVGAYADAMVEKMLNIRWFPFEMWSTGLPYVEVGDAIEIADKEGDTHISYVLQRQLNGIQNLQDTYINGQLDIF